MSSNAGLVAFWKEENIFDDCPYMDNMSHTLVCLDPFQSRKFFEKKQQFSSFSPEQKNFFLLMPRGLICSFSRGIQGVCNWDGILDCSAIYLSALERVFNAKLEISRSNKKGPFFILQENSNIFKLHVSKV